jgi:hypothetical protein
MEANKNFRSGKNLQFLLRMWYQLGGNFTQILELKSYEMNWSSEEYKLWHPDLAFKWNSNYAHAILYIRVEKRKKVIWLDHTICIARNCQVQNYRNYTYPQTNQERNKQDKRKVKDDKYYRRFTETLQFYQ